jgi:hypothetical protein
VKLWIYHHRATVKAVYCALALAVILALQILEATGTLP